MDFSNVPYFGLLDENFVKKIEKLWFSGPKMVIVTKSDEVYGFGKLPDSSIHQNIFELRPIHQLDKKQVKKFVFGDNFVMALTANGDLFSWGENNDGQLGPLALRIKTRVGVPTTLISSTKNVEVTDVACGSSRSMALFSNKMVCTWGKDSNCENFRAAFTDVKGIACSAEGFFYLTSNGEVYGKNYLFKNDSGHLCLGNDYFLHTSRSDNSVKIDCLKDIVKIAAGKHHVIALDNAGAIFVWGSNEKGQLTDKIKKYQRTPVKLLIDSKKIIDIAANSQSDLSAVMAENGEIYVWGLIQGESFCKPFLTSFKSFNEVFANLSDPRMSYDAITFDATQRNGCLKNGDLKSIFDVEEDSDITMVIEEKNIYVHKIILKARSEYFHAMFTNQWKENNEKNMKITGYSYDSFRCFLSYLYTGEIDVTSENVFELMNIADRYSDEALLALIEKKLEGCSISGEVIKILKEMMKLSSSDYENFCAGMKKMMVIPTLEFSQ